jgi:hypothetical protein
MKRDEIPPPWIAHPGREPGDFYWREAGEPWLWDVWRPFWDQLDDTQRQAYLGRWPAPSREWLDLVLTDDLQHRLDEGDAQDRAAGILGADGRLVRQTTQPPRSRWRKWFRL